MAVRFKRRFGWWMRKLFWKHQLLRLFVIIGLIWIAGASVLWLAEHKENEEYFGSLPDAYWSIAVYLFSGLDRGEPVTATGKIIVTTILILSLGVVGIFAGTIASIFVEERMGRRRLMPKYKLAEHIIICNWNERGEPVIGQLHAAIVKDKRPVVVLSEHSDDIDFQEQEQFAHLEDVYQIKGDPTNEAVLKKANVQDAFSIIVLADPDQGNLCDAKSILVCMAINDVCKTPGKRKPNIVVEVVDPKNVPHLRRSGADEIVSPGEFGLKLLAQAALSHGLSRVYDNLLTVSAETNEVYLKPVPSGFIGKTFGELAEVMARERDPRNPVILVGVKTGDKIFVNPKKKDFETFSEKDEIVVISFEDPSLGQMLG